ncbi:MAG: hypothetical protein ACOX1P_03590 [Thermoguttaceae bacterium]
MRWKGRERSRMAAGAVVDGDFGRRAAVAVNLALHPDEAGWGRGRWSMGILGGGRR